MASPHHLVLKESVWICGELMTRQLKHANCDLRMLRARGAKIFLFKGPKDQEGMESVRRLLWQGDQHVILSWLYPKELAAIRPLLSERKNFSMVADDWWIQPYWHMREADHILFRKYHGVAVRAGTLDFVGREQPPFLADPRPCHIGTYTLIAAGMRPMTWAVSPLVQAWNWWRRRQDIQTPGKCLFLPFAINCASEVPLGTEPVLYDFSNVAGTLGVWLMRDPYVPFKYTFANLYHDRKLLTDAIYGFKDRPYKVYDCRREKNYWLPYDEYLRKSQQSRFVIVSGGLHDAGLPKYLEFARVATPMIGRGVPYEHPWLDDCLLQVDTDQLNPKRLKQLLDDALAQYPVLKENCLKWREKLLKLYDFNTLLDMLQDQADGKPIPLDYVRLEAAPSGRRPSAVGSSDRT
jgi:hypothetical protein